MGPEPVTNFDGLVSRTEGVGIVTLKKTTFEVPPPGPGLTTVTLAVLGFAKSEDRMLAVNRDLLTKVVVRAMPFQCTTEPETNPVPFTVSVTPALPGLMAPGTNGLLISGAGFAAEV
jgi:hypothetical protein